MSNPKKNINTMHPDKNPDDIHFTPSAHQLRSQEKIDIDQSGLGRKQGQTPADEQSSDGLFSQIDADSADAQERTEINDDDIRDQGDSTTDWDAESSRTGRHR